MKRLVALLIIAAGLGAGTASADHRYDDKAGFWKIYHGQPIRVGNVPNIGFRDMDVLRPWNNLVGWEMLRLNSEDPHIVFRDDMPPDHSRAAWVERIRVDGTSWFTKCIIHYKPDLIGDDQFLDAGVLSHEVGHCLGFPDHVRYYPAMLDYHRQCDRPDLRQYSTYNEVMSYCAWHERWRWWGDHDRWMVTSHGLVR